MALGHNALAEVRTANLTPQPKPSRAFRGSSSASQGKENIVLPHRPPLRPPFRPPSRNPSPPRLQPPQPKVKRSYVAFAPRPTPASSLSQEPTRRSRQRQSRDIVAHDADHPPATNPDRISRQWKLVTRFNAKPFSSIKPSTEPSDRIVAVAASAKNLQIATDQQCSFIVEMQTEA